MKWKSFEVGEDAEIEWMATEDRQFASPEAEEQYKLRTKRIKDVIDLEAIEALDVDAIGPIDTSICAGPDIWDA